MALAVYFAWDKFSDEPQPPPPAATPTPTPVVRLTPSGALIVNKRFSVNVEGGIHGFPAGKEVK